MERVQRESCLMVNRDGRFNVSDLIRIYEFAAMIYYKFCARISPLIMKTIFPRTTTNIVLDIYLNRLSLCPRYHETDHY